MATIGDIRYSCEVSKQGKIGDLLRQRIRDERERRRWSQAQVAEALNNRVNSGYDSTTIAKMESGQRRVSADELVMLADIFGATADALAGQGSGGVDVLWAASRLTSSAHKTAGELRGLQDRIKANCEDLWVYARRDRKEDMVQPLFRQVNKAVTEFDQLQKTLLNLADEFPLPGKMS